MGRRIGGAKALMQLAGAPLAHHAARALRPSVRALAVAGDAAAARALNAPALADPPGASRGPLAGVLAGLAWAAGEGASWLAVAPCDAPLLPDDLVPRLRAAAADAMAACAETDAGLEPLISLWRVDLLPRLQAALGAGAHPPVHRFMHDVGAARVRLGADEAMNVNTADDLARAEALLARR